MAENPLKSPNPGSASRPTGKLYLFLEDVRARGFRPRGMIDVGANRGNWTRLALSIFPGTPAIMVEPQREMEVFLSQVVEMAQNCHYVLAGAGRKSGELVQTIWHDTYGSSFLPKPNAELERIGNQRKTRIIKLDDYLAANHPGFLPDLVKLDVQGFELEVLSGAESLFGLTELFILETSLFRFLPNQPLMREVIEFMFVKGYEIYDITEFLRRPYDGALGQIDLAFVKADGSFRKTNDWNREDWKSALLHCPED